MRRVVASTPYVLTIMMLDSADNLTGKTGLTLTVTASKAGSAFASITPLVTELSNGWYAVELNASDTNTIGDLVIRATGTGANPNGTVLQVIEDDKAQETLLAVSSISALLRKLYSDFTTFTMRRK